ncbi:MAG: ribosome recycling factor [Sedimentisphaeraceae bacterium JB056]
MPTKAILKEHEVSMKKAVDFLDNEYKSLRTGRASTGLVDNLRVLYYGNMTPLNQMATVTAPDATSLVIKPFDPSAIKDIEKAIKTSDLGLSPMTEGQMIRLPIPPLSGERRQKIAAQVKQMAEQARISLRNIRRDAIKQIEDEEKSKAISEDERDKAKKVVDDMIKKYTKEVDDHCNNKTDDVLNG